MQLNSIVFPAPQCSYSTEKLFKDLVYIPRNNEKDCEEAIPCLYIPYDSEAKILMFFHGNAEDIGIAFEVLLEIRNCLKLSIFAVEYPGYGLYSSEPNGEQLLEDSLIVYDHLTKRRGVSEKDIIIFGRSIGSSPACYVANQRNPSALILMSPFKSLREVAKDLVGWFLSLAIAERFRNIDLIQEIKCPVFIVHGQKDKLIPYSHSQELHDNCLASSYCKLLLPPKMDHNDFDFDEDFIEPLYEFFKQNQIKSYDVDDSLYDALNFQDEYFFPPSKIVEYEKKLIKASIIWDIIEERKRQQLIKDYKNDIANKNTINNKNNNKSSIPPSNNVIRAQSAREEFKTQKSTSFIEKQQDREIKNIKSNGNNNVIVIDKDQVLNSRGRLTMNEQMSIHNRSNSQLKKLKTFEKKLNDGYEFDPDRNISFKNTEQKMSIKF